MPPPQTEKARIHRESRPLRAGEGTWTLDVHLGKDAAGRVIPVHGLVCHRVEPACYNSFAAGLDDDLNIDSVILPAHGEPSR
jgi:hypothetical protein